MECPFSDMRPARCAAVTGGPPARRSPTPVRLSQPLWVTGSGPEGAFCGRAVAIAVDDSAVPE
jgi:hypothetical protein